MSTIPSNSGWYSQAAEASPWAMPRPIAAGLSVHEWLHRRPARVALLLAAVWLLNMFDLHFTLTAARMGPFIELNPVAARMLETGDMLALTLYKVSLVAIGSAILWQYRRLKLSELGCWMLVCMYSGVAIRWQNYYAVWNHAYSL